MAVQPFYENLSFTQTSVTTKQSFVECKFNSSLGVAKVLCVKGCASAISEEVVDGEIILNSRIVFYLIYQGESGEIKKIECGVEFSQKTERLDAKFVQFVDYSVSDIDISEGVIKALLTANVFYIKEQNRDLLCGGEDLLTDTRGVQTVNLACHARDEVQIDGEFDLNYAVKDILSHEVSVSINECKCEEGQIFLQGNAFLSLSVLQNNQKNDIVKESKVIPFKLNMDLTGANSTHVPFVRASVCKNNFKVVVEEDKNKSTVVVGIDLDCFACAYETLSKQFAVDAYSPKNKVEIECSDCFSSRLVSCGNLTERVMGATDQQVDGDNEVVCVCFERVENLSFGENNATILGVLQATIIYRSEEGYSSKVCDLPFAIPYNAGSQGEYYLTASIENFNYRVRATVELEALLKIAVYEIQKDEYRFVSSITVGEDMEANTRAISVYFARRGDTLWKVCKTLGVSAERITALNPSVNFPLSGDERIIVYRQI